MKENWDLNDFQGKSEKNYQTTYIIIALCIALGVLVVTWVMVYKLIKMIF